MDYDFVAINLPMADDYGIGKSSAILGEKLHLNPQPEFVKVARASEHGWLQVASNPWVLRLDVDEKTKDEVHVLKEQICAGLTAKFHVCYPSSLSTVSLCVYMS